MHLNLIEDLQERAKHLHDVIQKKKWMRKMLRAWYTIIEEDFSDGDDHGNQGDGIGDRMEIEGTHEDLESQKSHIESLDDPTLTSNTIHQMVTGQNHKFDAIFDQTTNVVKISHDDVCDEDDAIEMFLDSLNNHDEEDNVHLQLMEEDVIDVCQNHVIEIINEDTHIKELNKQQINVLTLNNVNDALLL